VSDQGTLATLAQHLALALQPLEDAVADVDAFRALLYRLGWEATSHPPAYVQLGDLVSQALASDDALADEADSAAVAAALERSQAVYTAVQQLTKAPGGIGAKAFLAEAPDRIFELLLVDYLAIAAPTLYTALRLLDVIQLEEHKKTDTRPAFVRTRFVFEELPRVVDDPASIPARVYGWGTPALDFPLIAEQLLDLALALGLPASIANVDPLLAGGLQAPAAETAAPMSVMLHIPVFELDIAGAIVEGGLELLELPAESGKPPGLILEPSIPPQAGTGVDLGGGLALKIRAGSDLASTFGIVVRPGEIDVRYPFAPGTRPPSTGFGASLVFTPDAPKLLLGEPGATRLQIAGTSVGVELDTHGTDVELRASLQLAGLAFVLAAGDTDGFLARLIGSGDITVPVPLDVRWSSRTGLTFSESAALVVSSYPHLSLGPVDVEKLSLAVRSAGAELTVDAGLGLTGAIGPVEFTVDDVGMRLHLRFAEGNAGPFDVAAGFKPPNGLGLAIEAGPVSGGGFLFYDPAQEQYAGGLQLELSGIALKAVGVLTTRLPGGASGFSLLVIVSAEFTPVQLGLGFTLNGVGGLIGINRVVATDVLQARLTSGALESILFPDDPVGHAQQLVATISTVFPPAQGRYVIGPTARIGWGTPTLVTIDIALVLELPAPVRLIILGRLRALLPDEQAAIVRLQMDVLGVIDFDRREASAYAVLVDSRLASFPLTGAMAMKIDWGDSPTFLLAVGGFNPRFLPPPGFPRLDRVAIALGSGDNPRLRLEGYLALTSNTLQFGARLDLSVAAGGFGIVGLLAFDALMELEPLSFVVDIAGSVAVTAGGHTLFSVTLTMTLSGPEPWHARGRASFSILFFDFSVHFDLTIGEDGPPPLPQTVEVAPLLLAALRDARSWSAQLPAGGQSLVTLRTLPPTSDLLAHPHGTLQVRQRLVPLERVLDRFGGDVPTGSREFRITAATLAGDAAQTEPLDDLFAAAQFTSLTDDQKLSRPSFTRMVSGVRLVEHDVAFGLPVAAELDHERVTIPAETVSPPAQAPEGTRAVAPTRRRQEREAFRSR
jgi:hypothetical protein